MHFFFIYFKIQWFGRYGDKVSRFKDDHPGIKPKFDEMRESETHNGPNDFEVFNFDVAAPGSKIQSRSGRFAK